MNVSELSLQSLEVGEHGSVVFEGREISNVQMHRDANRIGNALKALGVQRGDRVIMQMPNTPEVFQAFQAIWRIGAIAVPINYQVGQEEIDYIYSDCGVNTGITSPEYLDKVRTARSKSSSVKNIILVGGEAPQGTLSFADLVAAHPDEMEMANMAEDDVACLIYTSGTTGVPKGVMLTHGGLAFSARAQQETTRLPQDLVTLAMLPLCHSFGVAMMNGSYLRLHGKVVIHATVQHGAALPKHPDLQDPERPRRTDDHVYMLMYPMPPNTTSAPSSCGSAALPPVRGHVAAVQGKIRRRDRRGWA
jgi:long-chain acyl-CoA synthetase